MGDEMSPQLAARLRELIAEHGLDDAADLILANARECYAMVADGEDDYSATGNTRFGGDPDLPEGAAWPMRGDCYANFVAQVNCAELPPSSARSLLPSSGMIYFFVRYIESAAAPVEVSAIFFDGDPASLRRVAMPDPERPCDEYLVDLIPQRVRAVPSIGLPICRNAFRGAIDEAAEDESARMDLCGDLELPGQIGQLFGFANAYDERRNLYREVALARLHQRELVYVDYWDSLEAYEKDMEETRLHGNLSIAQRYEGMRERVMWLMEHQQAIAAEADAWRLLFRLDSNNPMNLNINDADPLYVFIRDDDLRSGSFADVTGEVTQG